jgi:hypothetical protein
MNVEDVVPSHGNSRKRSRSSTPVPTNPAQTKRQLQAAVERDAQLIHKLSNEETRNDALNDMLKLSLSHDPSFAMSSDSLLQTLAQIVKECLEWNEPHIILPEDKDSKDVQDNAQAKQELLLKSKLTWIQAPTPRLTAWFHHCRQMLGTRRVLLDQASLQTLDVILVILRNLSYVGANLRLFIYVPDILAILGGCLYERPFEYKGTDSSLAGTGTHLALAAAHVLLHLAPYWDVSGQRRTVDRLFYRPHTADGGPVVPDPESFGWTANGGWGFGGAYLAKQHDSKEDTMENISKAFLLAVASTYLESAWSIFGPLGHALTDPSTPRNVLLMVLDVLQELINVARIGVVGNIHEDDEEIPTLRAILVHMPDNLLSRLVDCLYIPRLGPDAIDYVDPVHNVVTRVNPLKLLMGYEATVDTEVRDRVLDILVPLVELDAPRMAIRLGHDKGAIRVRLFDALVPAVTTTVGRNDASLLATQLLRELSKTDANRVAFQYIQSRLVTLASKDTRVAHLVWNHLYKPADRASAAGSEEGDGRDVSSNGSGDEDE